MKIERIRLHVVRQELGRQRFCYSQAWYGARTMLLLEMTTDTGVTGCGEAFGNPHVNLAILEHVYLPMVLGRDPLDRAVLWRQMYNALRDHGQKGATVEAISAVDIALWDIAGKALGLPDNMVYRQPFPGPGLAIRCLGAVSKDKLDILRDADFIFRDEIAKAHLEQTMNQYFAVLTNMRSVGVMGDGRTYDYTLALRSVTTTDFMTANWTRIPYDVLDRVSVRIVNEVKGINRIVYDITSKPPATIEWE